MKAGRHRVCSDNTGLFNLAEAQYMQGSYRRQSWEDRLGHTAEDLE